MAAFFISRSWRTRKTIWALLALEFFFTVAVLTLFGIASPNTYRTKLWQEGGDLGYNSAPNTVLYALANYKPVKTPLVWNSFLTQWNLVISVLGTFILICKTTLFALNVFYPIISLLVHALEVALYAYSVHGQTGHDTIDPDRPSTGLPWYIGKSCGVASTAALKGYCLQAKSAFVVTCLVIGLYSIYMILSIYSMIPNKEQRAAHASNLQARADRAAKFAALNAEIEHDPDSRLTLEQHWAQQQQQQQQAQWPRSPSMAPTPYSAGFSPHQPTSPYAQWQQAYGGSAAAGAQPAKVAYGPDGQIDWSKQQWEMHAYPQPGTPGTAGGMKSPVTPRTGAFHTLSNGSGDLPLRQN